MKSENIAPDIVRLGRLAYEPVRPMGLKIAVVGATGTVGREMLVPVFDTVGPPAGEVVALASRRSAGHLKFRSATPGLKCRCWRITISMARTSRRPRRAGPCRRIGSPDYREFAGLRRDR